MSEESAFGPLGPSAIMQMPRRWFRLVFVFWCVFAVVCCSSFPVADGAASCLPVWSSAWFGATLSSCAALLRPDFQLLYDNSTMTGDNAVLQSNYLSELFPNVWSGLLQGAPGAQGEGCVNAVASFMCAQTYPTCAGGGGNVPCSSWAVGVRSACASHPRWGAVRALLQLDALLASNVSSGCFHPADVLSSAPSSPSGLAALPSLSPPFLPACAPLSALPAPNVCGAYLPADYSYYSYGANANGAAPNDFLSQIESGAVALDAFKLTMPFPSQLPCYKYYMAFLCTEFFPPCQSLSLPVNASDPQSPLLSVPAPQLVTEADCLEYSSLCSLAIAAAPLLDSSGLLLRTMNVSCAAAKLPTLAATALYSTVQQWPSAAAAASPSPSSSPSPSPSPVTITITSLYPIYRIAVQMPTYALFTGPPGQQHFQTFPLVATPVCPYPLNAQPDEQRAIANGFCQLPCPYVFFTDSQWNTVEDLTYFFGSCSFALCTFLVLTWLIFPEKRRQRYVLYFLVCMWTLAFVFVVGMINVAGTRLRYMNCAHKDQQNYIDDVVIWEDGGACVWQGILIMYFSLSAAFWWMVNAVDLYLNVRYSKQQKFSQQTRRNISLGYHILCWVYPFLLTCIMFNWKGFGGTQTLTFCFVTDYSEIWPLFFYQTGVALAIGFLAMVRVMWLLHQSALRVAKGSHPGKDVWKRHLRALAFIFEFLCIFIFIIAYNANDHFLLDQFTTALVNYTFCLLGPGGGTARCGDVPSGGPNVPLWIALHIVSAGQGFFAFLVYGTQKQNFVLWHKFFKRGCRLDHMAHDGSVSSDGDNPTTPRGKSMKKGSTRGSFKDFKHQRSHTSPAAAARAAAASTLPIVAGASMRPNLSLDLHTRTSSEMELPVAPISLKQLLSADSSSLNSAPSPQPTPSTIGPHGIGMAMGMSIAVPLAEVKEKENDATVSQLQGALDTTRGSEDSLNSNHANHSI